MSTSPEQGHHPGSSHQGVAGPGVDWQQVPHREQSQPYVYRNQAAEPGLAVRFGLVVAGIGCALLLLVLGAMSWMLLEPTEHEAVGGPVLSEVIATSYGTFMPTGWEQVIEGDKAVMAPDLDAFQAGQGVGVMVDVVVNGDPVDLLDQVAALGPPCPTGSKFVYEPIETSVGILYSQDLVGCGTGSSLVATSVLVASDGWTNYVTLTVSRTREELALVSLVEGSVDLTAGIQGQS